MKLKKALLVFLAVMMFVLSSCGTGAKKNLSQNNKDLETIEFGGREWYVLDEQGDEQLILAVYPVKYMKYHQLIGSITWNKSHLRRWLNNLEVDIAEEMQEEEETEAIDGAAPAEEIIEEEEPMEETVVEVEKGFLASFSKEELGRIVKKKVKTPKPRANSNFMNEWSEIYKTWEAGNKPDFGPVNKTSETTKDEDYAFVLSAEEVLTYFKDKESCICMKAPAEDGKFESTAYWLRDMGSIEYKVAFVRGDGVIDFDGHDADFFGPLFSTGGKDEDSDLAVRPAMWIKK